MVDVSHMRSALALARRGLGNCWPNPSVGCVVVRDGRVVGRGVTAMGGRPHAETMALAMAGDAARGATVYVTLEPCCHWGRTPPCTDALIAAGVARVVVAVRDVDPRMNGAGLARLQEAGIAVEEGLLADEAADIVAGFRTRIALGRPLVTLKLASSLDGRIATRTGESKWITGAPARRAGHALRARHDAVMVGVGTVLADDPALTCRIPGYKTTPSVRVVADRDLRTPTGAALLLTAATNPTWILAGPAADAARHRALTERGVTIIAMADPAGSAPAAGIDLTAGLAVLAGRGINTVLVEGGSTLAASFLRADLVDRVAWFHAPGIIGGDGLAAAQTLGLDHLADMRRFTRTATTALGEDLLTELRRAA